MRCEDFGEIVAELNREGALHPEERTRALKHAAGCASCTLRLEEARGTEAALSDLAAETDAVGPPESLRRATLRKFGERVSETAAASRPFRWALGPRWRWTAAAAAAVAVIALVSPLLLRNVRQVSRDAAVRMARTAVQGTATRTENAGEFVPLQYGDLLADSDSFVIVRVRLDRSRLVDLGFGADVASDPDTVPADLLLGQDGIARAIRFVE